MRFLVDECTGPAVAHWLVSQGHDAVSTFDQSPGLSDDEVISSAVTEDRILVTNDKDFGDRIFRDGESHRGVLLLRLDDERSATKISVVQQVLERFGSSLGGRFVVATERSARMSKL